MSTARELIEDLQRGQEVVFPGGLAIKLPQKTRAAIVQALLAVVPPLAPQNIPLMVSEREFWFVFSPYAHHVTVDLHEQPSTVVTVDHAAYRIRSLTALTTQTRFQTRPRNAELISATLTFAFQTSKPFAVTGDYLGDMEPTRLSPTAVLAFAQQLLTLSGRSGWFGLPRRNS